LGYGVDVQKTINLNDSVSKITNWMRLCEKHKECHKSLDLKLPTRVLDVGRTDKDKIHLYITTPEEEGQYVALSYCWGSEGNLTTKKADLKDRCESIELSSIPPTLRDAITITRKLHIQYLWIDALCIVQDDDDDWKNEVVRMAEVYSNASLVISATRSANVKQGIFGPRTAAMHPWRNEVPSLATRTFEVPVDDDDDGTSLHGSCSGTAPARNRRSIRQTRL
jgi:hypothetical protein